LGHLGQKNFDLPLIVYDFQHFANPDGLIRIKRALSIDLGAESASGNIRPLSDFSLAEPLGGDLCPE
jgi:hypothetical protein